MLNYLDTLNEPILLTYLNAFEGFDTPKRFVCPSGMRPYSRFFYLTNGTLDFKSNAGDVIHTVPGDIIYLPFDVSYESSWIDCIGGKYYTIQFIIRKNDNTIINLHHDVCRLFHDNNHSFFDSYQEIVETFSAKRMGYHIKSQELFLGILYKTAVLYTGNSLDNRIREGVLYLENHYTEDITVERLAEICHISASAFRHRFTKSMGMPPVQYRNYLRMKKAKELLETGLYSVSQVCVKVNIADIYYFNRLFNKYYHTNPSSFLNRF